MKRGCIFFFFNHPEPSEGEAALFLPVMHPRAGLSSPLKYVNFPRLVSSAPCFQTQAEVSCSLPKTSLWFCFCFLKPFYLISRNPKFGKTTVLIFKKIK